MILLSRRFTAASIRAVRHLVSWHVAEAGLVGQARDDFVLAVHELVTNAVLHGGGRGRLDLRRHLDTLVCDVTDNGQGGSDLPVRLPPADSPRGRGLWLAHQLADTLVLDRGPDGFTASVTVSLLASGQR